MNRAERRRLARDNLKAEARYNVSQRELRKMAEEAAESICEEYERNFTMKAMRLMYACVGKVLMDKYWPGTYQRRLPGFMLDIVDVFNAIGDGKVSLEDLEAELWEKAGLKLVETEETDE